MKPLFTNYEKMAFARPFLRENKGNIFWRSKCVRKQTFANLIGMIVFSMSLTSVKMS